MTAEKYNFKVLIFDWDGTLIDSIERIVTSLQCSSKQVCDVVISDHKARSVIGLGLKEAIQQIHPEANDKTIQKITERYKHHYIHENEVASRLFTGVPQFLKKLIENNYILAVATGKGRNGLEHALEEHSMKSYFTITKCADETISKPHPQMLNEIIAELRVARKNTLMIGDSEHDLQMAKNAQIKSVGVTHGVDDKNTLMTFNPLTCLNHVTDLSEFLAHNSARKNINA